jgi:basic membrane protein A
MIIFRLVLCLVFWLSLSLQTTANSESTKAPLKVGFIMGGPITDYGWNQCHNDGRLYLERTMSGKVQTTFAEKVPENAEAARVMERMIAQGTKLVFLTTYGYLDPALSVAARHPDVKFMQICRLNDRKLDNVGVYFPYYYEPLYAAGIVAGRKTKSNQIGCIVGHTVPNVLAAVNAFTLGARSVNSKVKVRLVCTNSWNDPATESEATKSLAEGGADVVVSCLDSSLTVCLAAQTAGIYCVGINCDLNKRVPEAWLTGQVHNYGPLYVRLVQQVLNSEWKPGAQYYTIKDGYTQLASFGKAVPHSVQNEALLALQKLKDGKLQIFHGPLKDAAGKERIPAGQVADAKTLASMNWVVPGVESNLAK